VASSGRGCTGGRKALVFALFCLALGFSLGSFSDYVSHVQGVCVIKVEEYRQAEGAQILEQPLLAVGDSLKVFL
jgi:hypothetical protein